MVCVLWSTTKGADMNTIFLNIDWAAVLGVVGSLGVVAFMLLLIARMQAKDPNARRNNRPHQWAIR
jgi:hypothetical protein